MRARVILLAGPSGAGKSRLAERLGLPILPLDDYYKEGDDPTLPHFQSGSIDWDSARSWNAESAMAGLRELCRDGVTDAPTYDLSRNGRVGHRELKLEGAGYFIAEGIFPAELVEGCEREGLLATAICVRRSRWVTFALRLYRDLREQRKPPLFLLRRGIWLARREPDLVAALVAKGCTPMTPSEAEALISSLAG